MRVRRGHNKMFNSHIITLLRSLVVCVCKGITDLVVRKRRTTPLVVRTTKITHRTAVSKRTRQVRNVNESPDLSNDYRLNRKNCCVPEMGLVTANCPPSASPLSQYCRWNRLISGHVANKSEVLI